MNAGGLRHRRQNSRESLAMTDPVCALPLTDLLDDDDLPPFVPGGSREAHGVGHRPHDAPEAVHWQVPDETPVALVYNGVSHAVMMATPADLEDFAVGFSLAEGLLTSAAAIEDIHLVPHPPGVMVAMAVTPEALDHAAAPSRSMAGRSGCGLCGVESLEQAIRPPHLLPSDRRAAAARIPPQAIIAALRALPDHQPLNRQNFSVHAAAFCQADGTIVLAREDVGRHNALDKLIGACARQDISLADGFVVMSSRCSFELVQKACAVGIACLATLSAPTALALELAGAAGMVLASRSKGGGVVLFTPPDDHTQQTMQGDRA